MSVAAQDRSDDRDVAARYADYRPKVRSVLARQAPWLDSDARDEVYQQGWLAVLEAEKAGIEVRNELSYLFRVTLNIATHAVRSTDARRRITFDPISSRFTQIPDPGPGPLEMTTTLDEAAAGRALLDRLGPRQRAVAIRRYGHGHTPDEICAELGMTRRRYEKTIDRITARLGEIVADYHAGRLTSSDRKLLARCVLGEADEHEREVARRLVDTVYGSALLCHVRHTFRDAAMTTPLPAATSPDVVERVAAAVEHAKAAAAGVVGRAPASATEAGTNIVVNNPARGSGPLIVGLAACAFCTAGVGAGGAMLATGTSPSDVTDALVRSEEPGGEQTTTAPAAPAPSDTIAAPPPSTATTPAPAPELPEPAPAPEPAPTEPAPAPAAPRQEFGWEQKEAPAPSAPSAPASPPSSGEFATPAAPSGGSSSGSEFGFESP